MSGLGQSGLRLSVVGALTVGRDGRVLSPGAVGSRKARRLLSLLAVHGRRVVGLDRIVDVLWDDLKPRRPAQETATLVSRLRTVLGSGALVGDRCGYRLGDLVQVDLHDATCLVNRAEADLSAGDLDSALKAGREALDILDRGAVLEDQPDADWAEPARRLHFTLCRRARQAVGTAALAAGDVRGAQHVAERALAADPLDEAASRTMMQVHYSTGEPARALLVFERLRQLLATELDTAPAAPTRRLHLAILRHNVLLPG